MPSKPLHQQMRSHRLLLVFTVILAGLACSKSDSSKIVEPWEPVSLLTEDEFLREPWADTPWLAPESWAWSGRLKISVKEGDDPYTDSVMRIRNSTDEQTYEEIFIRLNNAYVYRMKKMGPGKIFEINLRHFANWKGERFDYSRQEIVDYRIVAKYLAYENLSYWDNDEESPGPPTDVYLWESQDGAFSGPAIEIPTTLLR